MTQDHNAAVSYLRNADPKLSAVIDQVGPCRLKRKGGTFQLLADSIISQQISTHAARTIRAQLRAAMPSQRITANGLLSLSDEDLRSAGISPQKQKYLRDLAQHSLDGRVNFRRLARISDERVIEELIQVKGIGRWTAQMFLMFGLGRPDIFAPADLGLQNAIMKIYRLRQRPDERRLLQIAGQWAPHRSVASWFLWRSLE